MHLKIILFLAIISFSLTNANAQSNEGLKKVKSIPIMSAFIKNNIEQGDDKNKLRDIFIKQGGAELFNHPDLEKTEKYLYDVNLCKYYVWRWNISADYNSEDKLQQIYINGDKVFQNNLVDPIKLLKVEKNPDTQEKIFKAFRLRPEATKGENKLAYLAYDLDGNEKTLNDQKIISSGPSQLDPVNMGKMKMYKDVNIWRSIFDEEDVKIIHDYSNDCSQADIAISKMR